MPRNRVEELESTVGELESTVAGLIEELVETKERVRMLEEETGTEAPSRVPPRREATEDGKTAEAGQEDVEAATAGVDSDHQDSEDTGVDDIIVA